MSSRIIFHHVSKAVAASPISYISNALIMRQPVAVPLND